MKKNKAFTVVEYMIVIVIIGLLAAMAIPAFVKVKTNSIAKLVYHGQTVSESDYQYLQTHMALVNDEYLKPRKPIEREPQVMPQAPTQMIMVIDGKRYRLVPE